jgi:hypothetical protein
MNIAFSSVRAWEAGDKTKMVSAKPNLAYLLQQSTRSEKPISSFHVRVFLGFRGFLIGLKLYFSMGGTDTYSLISRTN